MIKIFTLAMAILAFCCSGLYALLTLIFKHDWGYCLIWALLWSVGAYCIFKVEQNFKKARERFEETQRILKEINQKLSNNQFKTFNV